MENNLKRNTYLYVYIYINHFVIHLKLIQSYKSTIKNTVDWAIKQLKFTSHTLEAGKSKIKLLARLVSF